MKAHKTTIKMMALMAAVAIVLLAMATVAFAAPQPVGIDESIRLQMESPTAHELVHELAIVGSATEIEQADPPNEQGHADATDDGGDEAAQPDEFEDLPDGSEGDAGEEADDPSENAVPETSHDTTPSVEESQPPITVVTTTVPGETTHHEPPHRDHLAFTGGDQVAYLLGGALIIMLAAGAFFLGRGKQQDAQQ